MSEQRYFAYTNSNGTFGVFDTVDWSEISVATPGGFESNASIVAFDGNGQRMLMGMYLFDTNDWSVIGSMPEPATFEVTDTYSRWWQGGFCSDGSMVVVATPGGCMVVSTATMDIAYEQADADIHGAVLMPDGSELLIAKYIGSSCYIERRSTVDWSLIATHEYAGYVEQLYITVAAGGGHVLLTRSDYYGNSATLVSTNDWSVVHSYASGELPFGSIPAGAVAPDGAYVVFGSGSEVYIVDNAGVLLDSKDIGDYTLGVCISPDNALVASVGFFMAANGGIGVFEVGTWSEVAGTPTISANSGISCAFCLRQVPTPPFWTGLQRAVEYLDGANPAPVPAVGDYWGGEGGYYAGIWTHPSGDEYHMIVAPVEFDVMAANWTETTGEVPGARSNVNGPENTAALLSLSKQAWAAEFCAGTTIDGHSDFYLMAGGAYDRDIDGGYEASEAKFIVDALGAGSSSPNFGTSGPQAFQDDFYWTSTEVSNYGGGYSGYEAIRVRMTDGAPNTAFMNANFCRVRPIRRIPV